MEHHPHHHQAIPRTNKAFGLAVLFNLVFVIAEGIAGFMADSLALLKLHAWQLDGDVNTGDVRPW